MKTLDLSNDPHRRFNALNVDWVLVSPHRTSRPWQGQIETVTTDAVPHYDRACYMFPGNTRANGERNPIYGSTFAFTNDFAALKPDTPRAGYDNNGLLRAESEPGVCRVLCFSPRHDLTLARMDAPSLRLVIDQWARERADLAASPDIGYVQIFENRGAMMGASNPHPHGQVWASATVPTEVVKEHARQQSHHVQFGQDLLGDYLSVELATGERVVCDNSSFVALVPFWAVWPFETLVVPRHAVQAIDDFDGRGRNDLADILKRLLTRYDNLFSVPFPYSMGFHEAPADNQPHPEWRWHAHLYPPLLRSSTVRKFMVGYELMGMPQRHVPPEPAAERLRQLPEAHQ